MERGERNPMRDRGGTDGYTPAAQARPSHAEGPLTRVVEQQTAKLPSAPFLVAALGAMVVSAACEFAGKARWSHFIGMWAPTLLTAGVYNKMVKMFGAA